MALEVKVPRYGMTMADCTIIQWLKKEGEELKKGEPILVLETDKVTIEMPSPQEGVLLKVLKGEGEVVQVGQTLAVLGHAGENFESVLKGAAKAEPEKSISFQGESLPKVEKTDSGHRASPAARQLAKVHGVNIEEIQGTGPGGRVEKKDVMSYVELLSGSGAAGEKYRPSPYGDEELIRLTGMRKTIAEKMVLSVKTIPQVTTAVEVDMTEVVGLRKKLMLEAREKAGVHLTYLPFIMRGAVNALKAWPAVNSSIIDDTIVVKKYVNIGVAVALKEGLIVPVLHHADRRSIFELAKELADLSKKAREGRLSLAEVEGATFTITNAGLFGAIMSTPILVPGQCALLWIGEIRELPAVWHGSITARFKMNLCLTYDHRIIDGAVALQFLGTIKKALEEPTVTLAQ